MKFFRVIAQLFGSTTLLWGSLFGSATLISLVKQASGVELYGSPREAYEFFEWTRNNIYDFFYWGFFAWWTQFALPDWIENFITLYMSIGLALLRGDNVRLNHSSTKIDVAVWANVERQFDVPQVGDMGKIRRLFYRFSSVMEKIFLWPRELREIFLSLKFKSNEVASLLIGLNEHEIEKFVQDLRIESRSSIFWFFFVLLAMIGATTYFFYWNGLENLAGV